MKRICLLSCVFLLIAAALFPAGAQEVEGGVERCESLKYGIRGVVAIETLNQSQGGFGGAFVNSSMTGVSLIGAFAEYKGWELNVEGGYRYLSGELAYKFHNNWAALLGGSRGNHDVDFNFYDSDYFYNYNWGESWVDKYYVGGGYHNSLNRLKLKADGLLGFVKMSEVESTSIKNRYESDGLVNKRFLSRNKTELSPSFVWGINLYLELLPRESKNRLTPLVPFVEWRGLFNSRSNTSQSVQIEEWVLGNVVYQESAENKKLSIDYNMVRFGLKWYFKY